MLPDPSKKLAEARRLFEAGQLPAAFAIASGLLSTGDDLEVLVLAGVIAARTERLAEAAQFLERARAIDPNRYDAIVWLANVYHLQREFERAIPLLERALQINEKDASALSLLGMCQMSIGDAKQATETFGRAVAFEPKAAQSHFNLGLALRLQNQGEAALSAFLKALELDPNRAENYLQVFKQFQHLTRWQEALQFLEEGRRRHPNSVLLAEALATAYGRLQKPELAEPIFVDAQDRSPAMAVSYAKWLQEQGRFEDSVQVLERTINRHPSVGEAYRELAEAKAWRLPTGSLLDKAKIALAIPTVQDRDRMHLAYALAKAYEADENFAEAMRFYDLANDLAYHLYPAARTFSASEAATDAGKMAAVYPPAVLQSMRVYGSESRLPIFIIGMIRSGTTLLDQIVSNHPAVSSAGEQQFWNDKGNAIHRKWRDRPNEGDLPELAAEYLRVLREAAGPAERISDKMPLNFRHLGLLSCVFPNAKILHIRRDPLDTALSIYTTFFGGGPNFTYNKANIVAFYRSYEQFMDYWRSVLPPAQFHEVQYEHLVAEPEQNVRSIIEFCDLPWDEACLRFFESRSAVSTPSRWQARQPIYTSSIGRWHRFQPWLGELLALEPTSDASN